MMNVLWAASVFAYAVLLARLYWLGLIRAYPLVSSYLATVIAGNMLLGWFVAQGSTMHTLAYSYAWVIVQCIEDFSAVLAVVELFTAFCRHHYNFDSVSRWLAIAFAALAAVLCLFALPAEYASPNWGAAFLKFSFISSRLANSFLAAFSIASVCLFWIIEKWSGAVRYRRNVFAGAVCLGSVLALNGTTTFLSWMDRGHLSHLLAYSYVMLAGTAVLVGVWAAGISRGGETYGIRQLRAGDTEASQELWDTIAAELGIR